MFIARNEALADLGPIAGLKGVEGRITIKENEGLKGLMRPDQLGLGGLTALMIEDV